MKTVFIPLTTKRSDRHDILCDDGELAISTGFPIDENASGGNTIIPWDGEVPPDNGSSSFPAERYPLLEARFSLRREGLPPYSADGIDYPSLKTTVTTTLTSAGLAAEARDALAGITRAAEKAGLHLSPFLAYAAWRLDDGSNVMPTPPVLMIPNAGNILMRVTEGEAAGESRTVIFSPLIAVCSLGVSFSAIPEELPADIRGIDIFISGPLPFADTGSPPSGPATFDVTTSLSVSGTAWGADSDTHPTASHERGYIFPAFPPSDNIAETLKAEFRHSATFPAGIPGSGYHNARVSAGNPANPDYLCHAEISPKGATAVGSRLVAWGGSVVYPAATADVTAPPRFMFHPDPGIAEMAVRASIPPLTLRYPMIPHPTLSGSYYFRGFLSDPSSEIFAGEIPQTRKTDCPSMIAASREGKHNIFDNGRLSRYAIPDILAASEAHKTSTVSAYAGSMIYCFTEKGVFLAGMGEKGGFRSLGMLGEQHANGIVATMENGVAFVASGGIYSAQPAKTVCISDALAEMHDDGEWQEWLSEARLGYDFSRRLLIAAGRNTAYAHYTPDSSWHRLDEKSADRSEGKASFVTRPLKLGDAAKRKRILGFEIIGAEAEVWKIEGSDNLVTWETEAEGKGAAEGLYGEPRRFRRVSATLRAPVSGDTPALLIRYEDIS